MKWVDLNNIYIYIDLRNNVLNELIPVVNVCTTCCNLNSLPRLRKLVVSFGPEPVDAIFLVDTVHWASLGADLLQFFPISITLPMLHVHLHPTTTTTDTTTAAAATTTTTTTTTTTLIKRKSELNLKTFKHFLFMCRVALNREVLSFGVSSKG